MINPFIYILWTTLIVVNYYGQQETPPTGNPGHGQQDPHPVTKRRAKCRRCDVWSLDLMFVVINDWLW